MDEMALKQIFQGDRMSDSEIAALFAQLDRSDAVAPLDAGLQRLCHAVEELRRRDHCVRR